jgi:hypothetical protein
MAGEAVLSTPRVDCSGVAGFECIARGAEDGVALPEQRGELTRLPPVPSELESLRALQPLALA